MTHHIQDPYDNFTIIERIILLQYLDLMNNEASSTNPKGALVNSERP